MSANVALTDSFDQWRVKTNELAVMTQVDGMSNFIKVLDTTNSTSNTTGSIITAGGLGVLKSAVIGENLRIHGNVITDGDTTITGNLVFGDAATDVVAFTADINSSIKPETTLTFDLGSDSQVWANTYTGHLDVNQGASSGKPAIAIISQDGDQDGVRITASQDSANAFHINAHSINSGSGITVLADALTTGTALSIDSDSDSAGTRNVAKIINNNVAATGATPLYVKQASTNITAKFDSQTTIVIPVGTTAQRGTAVQGGIRYNSEISSFEGYSGSSWGSLGGLIDVDQDTKIIAETSAGADNDDLDFYTAGTQRMKIDETGVITVGVDGTGYDVKFFGDTAGSFMLWDQSDDALELTDSSPIRIGDDAAGDMTLYHNGTDSYITNKTGIMKLATETSGIAVQIGHGTSETTVNDNLTVTGDLTVNGTTSTINSTTMQVDDKNIELGTVATPSDTTADGGGLTLKGATDKTITWTNAQDAWVYNQGITVGEDGTGYDVKLFGDTAGNYFMWDESADEVNMVGTIKIKEQADAHADTADFGQIWVNTATPNELYFTTDAGDDIQITSGTAIAATPGGSTTQVQFNSSGAFTGHSGMVYASGTGTLTVTALTETSDRSLKENITNYNSQEALQAVMSLQAQRFSWKESGIEEIGLIADEVEGVLPEMVSYREDDGLKSLKYTKIIAVLTEAMKEQQVQIDELKSKILN